MDERKEEINEISFDLTTKNLGLALNIFLLDLFVATKMRRFVFANHVGAFMNSHWMGLSDWQNQAKWSKEPGGKVIHYTKKIMEKI